jgi:hypothetical protein
MEASFSFLQVSRLEKQNSTPESDYDNTPNDVEPDDTGYMQEECVEG